MTPKFPGTNVDMRRERPSESETTPRNERVLRVVQECEDKRLEDKLETNARIETLEHAVCSIKDEQRSSNRRTLLAVASIALVGALVTAVLGYWGQVQAIRAGASQANVGAAQAVHNGQPSTETTYMAGYRDGASIEGAKIRDTLLAQVPIIKSPDVVARPNKHR